MILFIVETLIIMIHRILYLIVETLIIMIQKLINLHLSCICWSRNCRRSLLKEVESRWMEKSCLLDCALEQGAPSPLLLTRGPDGRAYHLGCGEQMQGFPP